jgi:hypothetical protein
MRRRLESATFEPFTIVMNNGDRYDVPHWDFVVVTDQESLHVYKPGEDDPEFAHFDYSIVALHNVSSIEPLPKSPAA